MAYSFDIIGAAKKVASLINQTPFKEPQRAYNFEFIVAGQDGNRDILFFAKGLTVPTISRDPIVIDYLDTRIMYSGRVSSSQTFTVTFWDDQTGHVLSYMHDWMDLTGNDDIQEAISKKKNLQMSYTRTIYVDLKDTTDLLRTGRFEFTNAFPTEIGEINLSYDDSAVVEIPVTFAYDQRRFTNDIDVEFNWKRILT